MCAATVSCVEATWNEAFASIAARLKGAAGNRIAAIAGDLADAEAMFALKDLMTALGSAESRLPPGRCRDSIRRRAGYLFNTTIAGIEKADACLLDRHQPAL